MLTITGPGGIGKSRLAIELARQVEGDYRDGSWFVDLAGARDPALVAPMIAHALGVREAAGALPLESLKRYLAPMNLLMMLDSFEPVLAAAPLVIDLLSAAPEVRVVVTSRSVLRVRGEQEYPLAPLQVPDPDGAPDAAPGPALELFLERAATANPTRTLSDTEQAAAAEICRRLDGVPLALELAAARTRVLAPSALLVRLSDALDVLGSGPVDLPERQRALRSTLDWDHALLGEEEQVFFRRLSVFRRSFTLAAAEAVVVGDGHDAMDVMDGLDGLVGKSLVRTADPHPETGEPSFVMLQTVREYAREKLAAAGEREEIGGRHAYYVLARVEAAARRPTAEREHWLAVLEHEHADLRAALDWADRATDVDLLVRLAVPLGRFWRAHCHFSEGRRWLDRAVALTAGQRTSQRADLLASAAYLSRARGAYDVAEAQYTEAMTIREELHDVGKVASSQRFMGNIAYDRGDLDGAERWWQRSLATLAGSDDPVREMNVLNNLGVLAHHRGDHRGAIERYDTAYELAVRVGSGDHAARTRMNTASARIALGDPQAAIGLAQFAVRTYGELDDTWDLVDAVDVLARAYGGLGRTELAAWLFGAADSLRTALDVRRSQYEFDEYEQACAEVRAADPDAFARGFAAGASASLDQLLDRALAEPAS